MQADNLDRWGLHMYQWHKGYPEKGNRFAEAMDSVSQSKLSHDFLRSMNGTDFLRSADLDPGDGMIVDYLASLQEAIRGKPKPPVIEVGSKTASFSKRAAALFTNVEFDVRDPTLELVEMDSRKTSLDTTERPCITQRNTVDNCLTVNSIETEGKTGATFRPTIFLLRSLLWCLDDIQVVAMLQSFVPVLEQNSTILVCDLVSPSWGTFTPDVERIYRRRDVTLMTMHNAKQRTSKEWHALMKCAHPQFKVC